MVSCGAASRCVVYAKLSGSGDAKHLNMTKLQLVPRYGVDGVGSTGKRWTGFCASLINATAGPEKQVESRNVRQ